MRAPALPRVKACARPSEPRAPVRSTVFPERTVIALQELLHFFDMRVTDRLVEDNFAARHGDDPIAGLEDVVHVVADEDAGDVLRAKPADEAEYLVGLLDRQVIGRLV